MHDNPLFNTAADFINNTSRHVFLTGKAGTGKTTFLKYIRDNTRKRCVVVAPTGVAAINAGGVTMHSFFQLPLGPFLPVSHKFTGEGVTDQYTLFKNIRVNDDKRELFRDLELLIIDEVSMVRCDMLDATDAILRYFRRAPHTPFGGVQVLYIGDLFQLPPVMPEQAWSFLRQHYQSPFFFHSRVVQEAPPVYIELKKIYRQSQQKFIDILNRIRNNEATREDLDTLNATSEKTPKPGCKYVTLTTHNYKADRINAGELAKLSGKTYEFKGIVEGDFPDRNLPTDTVLQLKEGAQVMFIRNDKSEQRRYYNGKIATVTRIDSEGIHVALGDSEEELVLEQETWNNIRYSYNRQEERIDEEKLGSFTQFPIRLAWAITIHKSQGLTFEHAIIDAGESFAPGQVYVALSRCTSLDGLICHSKITPSSISTDPLVLEFARREAREEELENILQQERRAFRHQQLADTFDLGKLVDTTGAYVQLVQGKQLPDGNAVVANVRQMLRQLEELQEVSVKFRQQMRALLDANDDDKLRERTARAIEYFSGALMTQMLAPVDDHIASLKGAKKVKQFLRQVRLFRNAIARKINEIRKAQYGEIVFDPNAEDIALIDLVGKKKAEKGATFKETLAMLRQGMKAPEIAAKRGLVLGTIETHIAQLVKSGEIDIHECMDESRIAHILDAIRKTQADAIQPVKAALGSDYSYGEIRAVMNHLQLAEK